MYSKRVTRRSELAAQVATAAKEWSAPARERLEALLRPYLREGEAMPDVELLQELLGRLVDDKGSRLAAGDGVLQASLRGAQALRWRRDEEAEKLRDLLRSARFYLDRVHGRGSGKRQGIGHGLSWMAPKFLWRVGAEVAEVLLEGPPTVRPGSTEALPDPAVLSAAIRAQADKVRMLVAELHPQNAGSVSARGHQVRGLEETETIVRRSAGLLAELYKLGGLPWLAESVKPKFRRTPRTSAAKETGAVDAAAATAARNADSSIADLDWDAIRPVAAGEKEARRAEPGAAGRGFSTLGPARRIRRRGGKAEDA